MASFGLFAVLTAIAGLLLLLFIYPLFLYLAAAVSSLKLKRDPDYLPTVTMLTATRNAADLVDAKIENALALDYPADRLNIVITFDGPDPASEQRVASRNDPRVRLVSYDKHLGKASAINRALPHCTGEILLMSDVDALLEPGALRRLVTHLADGRVGGVSGRRVIGSDEAQMKQAQQRYISVDSGIKMLESRLGFSTANDGKLYAVRRGLINHIADGVTDDLYAALSVVSRGARFVFEPDARAEIRVPSRHPMHEVSRRRRVVCRSLTGIMMKREVLNPFRYGLFSIGLLVNKVLRRFLPVLLIMLFVGSLLLISAEPWAWPLFLGQLAFYGLAMIHLLPWSAHWTGRVRKFSELAFYFCVGNYGTLLGLLDFLSGKRVLRWEPVKQDQCSSS